MDREELAPRVFSHLDSRGRGAMGDTPTGIAKTLGVSKDEAADALHLLAEWGDVENAGGLWHTIDRWGDDHRREAVIFLLGAARRLFIASKGPMNRVGPIATVHSGDVEDEGSFRRTLREDLHLRPKAIERAVTHVHDYAEGRRERTKEWRCMGIHPIEEGEIMWRGASRPSKQHRENRQVVRVEGSRRVTKTS